MSAIFGIIDLEGRPIDPEWIKSMQNDLTHRGPDGQGLYREESMFMGHMLLQVTPESIYDTSPYEEDGFVITAYARLDEREAIMDRIGTTADERDKITDPLLLLRSFIKFGKDFVKDIYGDFAFAIWDKRKKELFCARDHMGVKPFLYHLDENRFIFSTELKSIVNLSIIKPEINQIYLRNKAIEIRDELTETAWRNVKRLRAAHSIFLSKKMPSIRCYWKPEYKRNKSIKTEDQSAQALKNILERVIYDQTRTIGEIGAPLSGGLDSSSVVCIAAKLLTKENKKLTTVSSVYHPKHQNAKNPDETIYINEIINQEKNIVPGYVYHTDLSFSKNLVSVLARHYSPMNGFHYVDEAMNQYLQSKSIRRVLSGYLGDITATNWSFNPFPVLLTSLRLRSLFRLIIKVKTKGKVSYFQIIKSKIIFPFLPDSVKKLWLYFKNKKRKNPFDISEHPIRVDKKEKKVLQSRLLDFFEIQNLFKKDIVKNICPRHIDFFEEDWDCGSSWYGLEITYPFSDRRVVEFLLQMPVEHFFSDGTKRGLIKKAMENILPEKIRSRIDKGHYSPGYPQIIKNDKNKILDFIQKESKIPSMGKILDYKKLNTSFLKLLEKNDSFVYSDWVLIKILIWMIFAELFTMYDANLKTINHEKSKKEMEQTTNFKFITYQKNFG